VVARDTRALATWFGAATAAHQVGHAA